MNEYGMVNARLVDAHALINEAQALNSDLQRSEFSRNEEEHKRIKHLTNTNDEKAIEIEALQRAITAREDQIEALKEVVLIKEDALDAADVVVREFQAKNARLTHYADGKQEIINNLLNANLERIAAENVEPMVTIPALPKEAGWYTDCEGSTWRLMDDGWYYYNTTDNEDPRWFNTEDATDYLPFTYNASI